MSNIVEELDGHCVTSRVFDAVVNRMLAMIYADTVAMMADGKLGELPPTAPGPWHTANGLLQLANGRVETRSYIISQFDADQVFSDGSRWWFPGDDEVPPSSLRYRSSHPPADIEHEAADTLTGRGTGKLVPLSEAVPKVMKVAARAGSRMKMLTAGGSGYVGAFVDKAAHKIVGRAAGHALQTLASNVLLKDRRVDPHRYISTRNWETGKTVGRHCGYAAYWKPPGRPALPWQEAYLRRLKSQRARCKTNRRGKSRGGPHPYQTKNPRPEMREWSNLSASGVNPAQATAKIINHKRGTVCDRVRDKIEQIRHEPTPELLVDIAREITTEFTQALTEKFVDWVKRGIEGTAAQGGRDKDTLNTPRLR